MSTTWFLVTSIDITSPLQRHITGHGLTGTSTLNQIIVELARFRVYTLLWTMTRRWPTYSMIASTGSRCYNALHDHAAQCRLSSDMIRVR